MADQPLKMGAKPLILPVIPYHYSTLNAKSKVLPNIKKKFSKN